MVSPAGFFPRENFFYLGIKGKSYLLSSTSTFFHFFNNFLWRHKVQNTKSSHLITHVFALRAKILDLGNVNASIAAALGFRILQNSPQSDKQYHRQAKIYREWFSLF